MPDLKKIADSLVEVANELRKDECISDKDTTKGEIWKIEDRLAFHDYECIRTFKSVWNPPRGDHEVWAWSCGIHTIILDKHGVHYFGSDAIQDQNKNRFNLLAKLKYGAKC